MYGMFVTTVRTVDFVCALQVHLVVIIPHSEYGTRVCLLISGLMLRVVVDQTNGVFKVLC